MGTIILLKKIPNFEIFSFDRDRFMFSNKNERICLMIIIFCLKFCLKNQTWAVFATSILVVIREEVRHKYIN